MVSWTGAGWLGKILLVGVAATLLIGAAACRRRAGEVNGLPETKLVIAYFEAGGLGGGVRRRAMVCWPKCPCVRDLPPEFASALQDPDAPALECFTVPESSAQRMKLELKKARFLSWPYQSPREPERRVYDSFYSFLAVSTNSGWHSAIVYEDRVGGRDRRFAANPVHAKLKKLFAILLHIARTEGKVCSPEGEATLETGSSPSP